MGDGVARHFSAFPHGHRPRRDADHFSEVHLSKALFQPFFRDPAGNIPRRLEREFRRFLFKHDRMVIYTHRLLNDRSVRLIRSVFNPK